MTPYHIPTPAEIAPVHTPTLSQAEREELFYRALDVCPADELADNAALFAYLKRHGVSVTGLSMILDAAIDEARAARLTERW